MDYFVDLFIFIQLSYFWRAEKFLETGGRGKFLNR